MEMLLLLVTVLWMGRGITAAERFYLETWQRTCLRTHNSLRKANGLEEVSWNNLLHSLAGIKAANLVRDDYRLSIEVPSLDARMLKEDRILFNHEVSTTRGIAPLLPMDGSTFFALATKKIISDWCHQGESDHYGSKSARVLDPAVDQIGCSMNTVTVAAGRMQIYLIVSYQRSIEKIPKRPTTSIIAGHISGKSCKVECPDSGMCLSFTQPDNYKSAKTCSCKFDVELWSYGRYTEAPRCTGYCFVYCPFSNRRQKRTCRGNYQCTCSYSRGGAACA